MKFKENSQRGTNAENIIKFQARALVETTPSTLLRLSLLEILSRVETSSALCERKINDLHFWKTTYINKDLMELHYA